MYYSSRERERDRERLRDRDRERDRDRLHEYDLRYEYRDRERELYERERDREREVERERCVVLLKQIYHIVYNPYTYFHSQTGIYSTAVIRTSVGYGPNRSCTAISSSKWF